MMVNVTNLQNLTRLTSLKLWENGITDISTVAKLTNLTCLDLRWNSITNFASPISGLTNLTSLYLGGNSISNVPNWNNLKQLTLLNLDDNRITDLRPLTNLANLNYLAASRNPRADFSVLPNLPGLVSLELRGNSVSNVNFLSRLSRLGYADLAYNRISDLRPLTNLTGLNSLVLAGNPLADFAPLGNIPNLTNLWLFDNSISNASFVANLSRLNHLNLDQNKLTDIGSLAVLTNLTGLGLSGNRIGGYSELTHFTKLTSLRLDGNRITTNELATFLPGLTQLEFLSLNHNQIGSLSQIEGLTRLEELYLRRNGLGDIGILTNLPNLLGVDVSLNLLDLTIGSAPMTAIRELEARSTRKGRCACALATNETQGLPCQGMVVTSQPQNQAPRFTSLMRNQRPLIYSPLPKWFIPANTNSFLTVSVWEDPPPEDSELVVTAVSSNSNLVSVVSNFVPGTNYARTLAFVAGNASDLTATITLSVRDEVLLAGSTNVLVTVVANTKLSELCPELDPNLMAAISASTGKAVSDLGTVDLLMLSELYVQNVTAGDSCAWEWLTNVTTFGVSGDSTTNLTFLTNLTQLTSLALNSVSATDFSPLSRVKNLLSLSLHDGSISNLSFLTNLTQLTSLTLDNVNVTDFSPVNGLSNLLSLSLYGASISNLSFLTNLTQLVSLNLYKTLISDLSPLAGLTNLQFLHLQQNRLTNIVSLTNLWQLSYVDVRHNLLDLDPGTPALTAIETLASRGVPISYWPQRQPPAIAMNTNWNIAANAPAWLYFLVLDDVSSSDLSVGATASNAEMIPGENLVVGQVANQYGTDWFLQVATASNQVGTTTISVTATNDAGLSTTSSIKVAVHLVLPLDGSVFPDTNVTSWVTGGDASWFGQANVSLPGVLAAQSGSTTNNGDSWLQSVVNGPGMLTFWWKVSSETNFDFLKFYIDTNEQSRISGEVDWQKQTFGLSPGPHTLLWHYSKDLDVSSGMDAGWVAQVSFAPASWLEVAAAQHNGGCTLILYGQTGKHYRVLVSTNLINWDALGEVTATNSVMEFIDSTAGPAARFYRLQELPAGSVWLENPTRLTNGTLLVVHGPPGIEMQLQVSTNLTSWTPLALLTNIFGSVQYTDVLANIFPMRAYRVVAPPP